jgi:toxin secretion/phage lysis holin
MDLGQFMNDISRWFGENPVLGLFIIAVLLDVLTGVYAAAVIGNLSSEIATNKLLRKLGIFFLPIVALIIERALAILNMAYPVVTGVCLLLLVVELTSIAENLKRAGINIGPIEGWLKIVSERTQDATSAGVPAPSGVVVRQTIELPPTPGITVEQPKVFRAGGTGELKIVDMEKKE